MYNAWEYTGGVMKIGELEVVSTGKSKSKIREEWLKKLSFSDLVKLMNMSKESLKDTIGESLEVTDSNNIFKNTKS